MYSFPAFLNKCLLEPYSGLYQWVAVQKQVMKNYVLY